MLMEAIPLILLILTPFVAGVMVGYGIRSLVSKKRRERVRKQRVDFRGSH
jgi:uncharacterized integral membrane protein